MWAAYNPCMYMWREWSGARWTDRLEEAGEERVGRTFTVCHQQRREERTVTENIRSGDKRERVPPTLEDVLTEPVKYSEAVII